MDKITIDTKRLTDLIDSDINSPQKQRMYEGVRYYNIDHDILQHVNYYFVEMQRVVDVTKANNTIPHPFHKKSVDEKVRYVCSKPINVNTKEPEIEDPENPTANENKEIAKAQEFQNFLVELMGDKFNNKMTSLVKGAANKGFETVHPYIDSKGEFRYIVVPSQELILIYDTQYQDVLTSVVRYYTYELVTESGQKKTLYKVEYWTDNQVEYWEQQENLTFKLDPYYDPNPAGHFHKFNTTKPGEKKQHGWGRPPFVVLKNNDGWKTDLEPVKGLIDSYDKVKSGWCNDLDDFQELIYIVKGYQGLTSEAQSGLSELAIFMQNLKTHKVIPVEVDGAVSTLKAEIPVDAKLKFLEITKREIAYFSDSVYYDVDKTGNNPSGVALDILQSPLDRKADEVINEMKVALSELFWFFTKFINMKYKKDFDSKGIVFTFTKSRITNDNEKVDMLNKSQLSQQTYLEQHPSVDNAEDELARIDRERAQRIESGLVDLDSVVDEVSENV